MSHDYPVLQRQLRFTGAIYDLVSDEVGMPGGVSGWRDYTRHLGAVAVAAVDEQDRIVLIRQYRHPVRAVLWELPAGLLDLVGEAPVGIDQAGEDRPIEDPVDAARRELAEEADLRAEHWQPLLDLHTSPGYSDERIRVYLARGLTEIPDAERHERLHEEAELVVVWVPLAEAVEMALRGEITNATAVAGILAAARLAAAGA